MEVNCRQVVALCLANSAGFASQGHTLDVLPTFAISYTATGRGDLGLAFGFVMCGFGYT